MSGVAHYRLIGTVGLALRVASRLEGSMVKLANGHYYRFARNIVARADVADNGWWQLTEIAGMPALAHASTDGRTWGIAPSGAFYAGPVITTDGSTTAGSALACHQDGLTEVVRSGIDAQAGATSM